MRRCLILCTGDVIDVVRAACCLCEAVRAIRQLHFDRDTVLVLGCYMRCYVFSYGCSH